MKSQAEDIRNFCIIAHIDHGKSTLADRMLQITGTVVEREMREQFLDKLELERERGITIKLQAVRMKYSKSKDSTSYKPKAKSYILNLIDTPGHIDFSYEVSRALAACEGALLLVDAVQGIQAQTLANYFKAAEAGLTVIPVVNKIDLPNAEPENTAMELIESLNFSEDEIIFTSGKTGEGVEELMNKIVERIPTPSGGHHSAGRALIFDSYYDQHLGIVALVRVIDGKLVFGEELSLINMGIKFTPLELGFITGRLIAQDCIGIGEVGYLATGLKDIRKVRVGDTVGQNIKSKPLAGYKVPKSMVFANIYPEYKGIYNRARDALDKYRLMDSAFLFEPVKSEALGMGFRCGFLGLLHLDIVRERLRIEFDIETTVTAPGVLYRGMTVRGNLIEIQSPEQMPDKTELETITEPFCLVKIFTQVSYIGSIIKLSSKYRSKHINTRYIGEGGRRAEITYEMPLADLISTYHDRLKSVSAGYASLDYNIIDYREVNLVKLDVMLNYKKIESLSRLVVLEHAEETGRNLAAKLKELLPQENFRVPIQAVVGGKVVARETLPALRKDVTAKLYGGDRTRKDKLLKKQAKGKKRMQKEGSVRIPGSVYQKILSV